MIKRFIIVVLMFISLVGLADEAKFSMSAPKIVSIGDQFSLTLSLNAKGSDLRMPQIEGFDILMGPSVSSSRSFQSINGKMTQSVNYTYTYILKAQKVGKFNISPATIKAGRERVQSNAISIEVIKGRKPTNSNNSGNTSQQNNAEIGSKDNLFIRFETDKKNVYKGEMISAVFKLYSRVALSVVDQTMPSFEGFWTQDIEIPSADQTRTQQAVDGIIYNVYTLQKKILVPQQTGKLEIEPAEMVFDIQQRVRSRSVFDDFFGSVQNVRTKIKSDKISINVKELPAAPQGFKGAVGQFSVTSSIDKESIKANEAITIKIKVSGNGNLKHINPIEFDFPPDFEIYDPKTSYNYKASEKGIAGSTTFEQVIIPRYAGDFTIPVKKFVYFNPSTKSYKTTFTKQFDIHVEKGSDDQSTTVVSSLSKEDVKYIGKDIRYIKQDDLKLLKTDNHFFGSIPFYGGYILSILAFVVILILQKKRVRDNANVALMRNKKASKMARKHLKAAAVCVKSNNKDDFYEALLKAFWGYLSDKLTLPLSELNRDNAKSTLQEYTVDNETIDDFIGLIDTCEMARFAPSAVNEQIADMYKKAEKIIGKFEKQIRKKA